MRLWHRLRYGHWPRPGSIVLLDPQHRMPICLICYRIADDEDRRRGGPGW